MKKSKIMTDLLKGLVIVEVTRLATDHGDKIRLYCETDSKEHLGSTIDIPEVALPEYEDDIRALFYRQDPPFDPKSDIETQVIEESEDEDEEDHQLDA